MMMNIYYSSNRNNIDDTNKLFYKVVIFPILQKFTSYIDLIHDIIGVHSGVAEFCVSHRELCLRSGGTGRSCEHGWGHCLEVMSPPWPLWSLRCRSSPGALVRGSLLLYC